MTSNKLIIFDTTLRDGEQSPGASMTRDEKIRIAKQLERMRVDVIEAGFAAASQGDFESIKAIAGIIKDSTVCSLSRANERDISRAAEALAPSNRKRIHTFLATSPYPIGPYLSFFLSAFIRVNLRLIFCHRLSRLR